jgi:hypothetical protein
MGELNYSHFNIISDILALTVFLDFHVHALHGFFHPLLDFPTIIRFYFLSYDFSVAYSIL